MTVGTGRRLRGGETGIFSGGEQFFDPQGGEQICSSRGGKEGGNFPKNPKKGEKRRKGFF